MKKNYYGLAKFQERIPEGLKASLAVFFLVGVALMIGGEVKASFFLIANLSLTAAFIFLLIWFLTQKVICGLISGLFFIGATGVWSLFPQKDFCLQIWAMMMICLNLLVMAFYFSRFGQKKVWSCWLVVLAFLLAFLSHFNAGVSVSLSFLVMVYFQEKSWQGRIKQVLKIFGPVLGLTAFYYLPIFRQLFGQQGLIDSFGKLKREAYPGLPFFGLPLGGLVLAVVWLTRDKISQTRKINYRFFLAFGVLSLISFIYPGRLLSPAAVYLSLFLGLGFYFLATLAVINFKVLIILVFGLLTIALNQIPKLKKEALNQPAACWEHNLGDYLKERFSLFGHKTIAEKAGLVISLGTAIVIIKKLIKKKEAGRFKKWPKN